MDIFTTQVRFRHEIEWYAYYYIESRKRVAVCHKTADPCIIRYYTKEQLDYLIEHSKWDCYSLPVYIEAQTYFPKEATNEQGISR